MNVPARYSTSYLGDISVRLIQYTIDARHKHPRIGRIVTGRGRDPADVAMSTAFGIAKLARFEVVTKEQVQAG